MQSAHYDEYQKTSQYTLLQEHPTIMIINTGIKELEESLIKQNLVKGYYPWRKQGTAHSTAPTPIIAQWETN
jgi:hypothetical protein